MPAALAKIAGRHQGVGVEVTVRSDRFPEKVRMMNQRMRFIISKLAADGQATAQMHAPVRTGVLRASISHEVLETGGIFVGRVFTGVEYAAYQEFGTRFHPAHPFMAPAAAMMGQAIGPALRALGKQVENA